MTLIQLQYACLTDSFKKKMNDPREMYTFMNKCKPMPIKAGQNFDSTVGEIDMNFATLDIPYSPRTLQDMHIARQNYNQFEQNIKSKINSINDHTSYIQAQRYHDEIRTAKISFFEKMHEINNKIVQPGNNKVNDDNLKKINELIYKLKMDNRTYTDSELKLAFRKEYIIKNASDTETRDYYIARFAVSYNHRPDAWEIKDLDKKLFFKGSYLHSKNNFSSSTDQNPSSSSGTDQQSGLSYGSNSQDKSDSRSESQQNHSILPGSNHGSGPGSGPGPGPGSGAGSGAGSSTRIDINSLLNFSNTDSILNTYKTINICNYMDIVYYLNTDISLPLFFRIFIVLYYLIFYCDPVWFYIARACPNLYIWRINKIVKTDYI